MTGIFIIVVAVLVVLATSLFKQVQWTPKTKNLIATVLSIVGGAVTVYLTGGISALTTVDLLQTVTIIYGASQAIYAFMFKGTDIEKKVAEVGSPPPSEDTSRHRAPEEG